MLFSCSQESREWKETLKKNSVEAYREFAKKYPDKNLKKLDNAIWNLLDSYNSNERVIIYDNFKLRESPNLKADLILHMKKGDTVKIIEISDKKQKIDISGYTANAYWYKVALKNGTIGWVYSASVAAPKEYYETCKLYFDILTAKGKYMERVKEKFNICDCNVWENVKMSDNKNGYENYLNFFDNGMYSSDANLLKDVIGSETCYYADLSGGEFSEGYAQLLLNISEENHVTGNFTVSVIGLEGMAYDFSGIRIGKIINVTGHFFQEGELAGEINANYILGGDSVVVKDGDTTTLYKTGCKNI